MPTHPLGTGLSEANWLKVAHNASQKVRLGCLRRADSGTMVAKAELVALLHLSRMDAASAIPCGLTAFKSMCRCVPHASSRFPRFPLLSLRCGLRRNVGIKKWPHRQYSATLKAEREVLRILHTTPQLTCGDRAALEGLLVDIRNLLMRCKADPNVASTRTWRTRHASHIAQLKKIWEGVREGRGFE